MHTSLVHTGWSKKVDTHTVSVRFFGQPCRKQSKKVASKLACTTTYTVNDTLQLRSRHLTAAIE